MSQSVTQLTPDGSSIWLPGIVACIAHHLPANEVASTLRLIDKTTSQQFADHKTLRLSLSSPIHVFRERWGRPGAFRALSRKQRLQLLCLTAASGSVANLEVALVSAGLDLRCELLEAAAAAGQLDMCKVLRARGCLWGKSLSAAARGGHRHVCEWLLASGCPFDRDVVCAAAMGGQEDLMQWLLTELQGRLRDEKLSDLCWSLLRAAAEYLSLAALQRLRQQLMAGHHGSNLQQQLEQLREAGRGAILAAAAGSTTPDWQAKVEWMEGLGYPRKAEACESAVRAGDGDAAVARLQWLRGRGYPLDVADTAVCAGNLAALRFLVEQAGVRPTGDQFVVTAAARQGHLAVLQYLHASGCPVDARSVAVGAARAGHLPLVAWAVEGLGVAPADGADSLLDCAVESGNLELMIWLHARGWALGPRAIPSAIPSAIQKGCEEALEWLVERGCPFPLGGGAYLPAAHNGDLAMLRCLHRLGCPWGPPGKLLADCIRNVIFVVSVAVLQCLLDLGCPEPDWDAAVKLVEGWRPLGEQHAALLAWLGEQQRRRRSPGAHGA
ncbi:hypothetical protein PLESTF_000668300 [Pleodorina starrii]|nr:hypothetical protein PLESTF_000668300 [Pleodorina starrii]